MEQYVTEVLLRERKANVKKMTPEQRVEFKFFRKRLSRELDDEIQERKNKNKKNQQRHKQIKK